MGLLDWITDGGGSLWNADAAKQPFVGATNGYGGAGGAPDAGAPPMPAGAGAPALPAPDMNNPAITTAMGAGMGGVDMSGQPRLDTALPPQAAYQSPISPSALSSQGPPVPPGLDPTGGSPGNGPGLPPPPMPQARPAGAPPVPGAIPPPPPEQPPGAPLNLQPTDPNQPVKYPGMGLDAAKFPPHAESGFSPPNMQGGGGILGALGVGQDAANRMRGGLGAGLKAAGESAGKSPMQALAGGAGSAMEGGQKASDTNNKQTIDYLNTSIKAKQAGDTAKANEFYNKYLLARVKAEAEKAASSNAKGNSPEQLYFQAVRSTNADPALKGYNDAIRAARASGDTAAIAKAQAALEEAKTGIMNGHLGRVGLDPLTAGKIAQQPGNSQGNPVSAGLDKDNITKKLQPGQYYRNPDPKDIDPKTGLGKVYIYKGPPGAAAKDIPDKPTAPAPRDPNRPERGSRAAAPDTSDESEG